MRKQNYIVVLILTSLIITYYLIINSNIIDSQQYLLKLIYNQTNKIDPFKLILEKNATNNYVFIDLGANKGDSIYSFFGVETKEFNPYKFPELIDRKLVNQVSWTVLAFEANPVFDQDLTYVKDRLDQRHRVQLYNSTAAWTYDGKIDFYLDLVNSDKNFWGSR